MLKQEFFNDELLNDLSDVLASNVKTFCEWHIVIFNNQNF